MKSFFTKTLLAATVAVSASLFAGSGIAAAGDSCHHSTSYYKTVTAYQSVKKPYVRYVTKYDHCGKAYSAKVVVWKIVRVPVTSRVKVCY